MGLRSWLSRLHRRPRPATAPRQHRPALEPLETREVPATLTETYLAATYQGFLGRALDLQGLSFWTGRLDAGATRAQVAAAILDSPEAHGRQLQILYRTYLGRLIDPAGLNFFGDAMEDGGATYEQVKASVLGSLEFFTLSGTNNRDWLTAVYGSQLGRPLDQAGESFWNRRLIEGQSRQDIVTQILTSDEAIRLKVAGAYQEILARPLDTAGEKFWGNALRAGLPLENLLAGIAGSGEFRDQIDNFLTRTIETDPNVVADRFFVEGGRFDATLPALEILNRGVLTDIRINTLTRTIPGVTGAVQAAVGTSNTSFLGTTIPSQGVQIPVGTAFAQGVQTVAGTTAAQTFLSGGQSLFPTGGIVFPMNALSTANLIAPQGTVQTAPGSVFVNPLSGLASTSLVTPFTATTGINPLPFIV